MILKNRAYPYTIKGDNYANGRFVEMVNVYAGGALYSTVDDMYVWHKALHSGQLVSQKSLDIMFKPYKNIDEVIPYGCGFFVTELFNRKRVGHEGGLNGYLTQYYHFIEDDLTYIILGNTIQNIWKISDDIPAIVFGEEYTEPTKPEPFALNYYELDEFLGEYENSRGNISELTRKEVKFTWTYIRATNLR